MKQIQTIEKGTDFSAINFGNLDGIKDYVLELGPEIKIPGKVWRMVINLCLSIEIA